MCVHALCRAARKQSRFVVPATRAAYSKPTFASSFWGLSTMIFDFAFRFHKPGVYNTWPGLFLRAPLRATKDLNLCMYTYTPRQTNTQLTRDHICMHFLKLLYVVYASLIQFCFCASLCTPIFKYVCTEDARIIFTLCCNAFMDECMDGRAYACFLFGIVCIFVFA